MADMRRETAEMLTEPYVGNRERGRIQRRAMAGLDPTADEQARLDADMPRLEENSRRLGVDLPAELSGIPGMVRGAQGIKQGYDEGDLTGALAGAAELVTGAIPGGLALRGGREVLKAAYGSVPRAIATGSALSLPGAFSASRDAEAETAGVSRDDIRRKLQGMSPDQIKAYQQQVGATPDGRPGNETLDKALAFEAGNAAKIAVETEAKKAGEVARNKAIGEAEADLIRKRGELKLSEEQKESTAKKGVRDLYPELMPFLPAIATIAAGGAGSYIKSAAGRTFNEKMGDLSKRWKEAIDVGDDVLAKNLAREFTAAQLAGAGGTKAAIATGAGIGAEASILPEEIDLWRDVPGTWDRVTNIPSMAKRLGVGALMGGTAGGVGAELRGANQRRYHAGYQAETDAIQPGARSAPAVPTNPGAGPGPGGAGPQGGASGGSSNPPQQPPQRPAGPAYNHYDDATHAVQSRQYLDEMLTHEHPTRRAAMAQRDQNEHIATQLEGRYATEGFPAVDPQNLRDRVAGSTRALDNVTNLLSGTNSQVTNPRLRDTILGQISGRPDMLAVPAAAGLGLSAIEQPPDDLPTTREGVARMLALQGY